MVKCQRGSSKSQRKKSVLRCRSKSHSYHFGLERHVRANRWREASGQSYCVRNKDIYLFLYAVYLPTDLHDKTTEETATLVIRLKEDW